jgi:hypothetical protein
LGKVFVHAFTDGRDTDPKSGLKFMTDLYQHTLKTNTQIASVTGRYYAMDRDNRWERVALAYKAMVHGEGNPSADVLKSIEESYAAGVTDEFIHPIIMTDAAGAPIGNIILPSEIRQIYLTDTSTDAGIWRMIPFGEGSSAISVISTTSSNNSINITPGTITSPSGNFDFTLSASLQNLNLLTSNALPGFPVITANNPLTWKTVVLVGGTNVNIDNGDGVVDAPIINLNSAISGLTALNVGSFALSGTTLTTSETDGSLALSSNGKGHLGLNGVNIDTLSNITNVNNLTVSGSITSPAVASAQCFFFDNNDNITMTI